MITYHQVHKFNRVVPDGTPTEALVNVIAGIAPEISYNMEKSSELISGEVVIGVAGIIF